MNDHSDMVKRLINKMDFEALEVKIKKCKVINTHYYNNLNIISNNKLL